MKAKDPAYGDAAMSHDGERLRCILPQAELAKSLQPFQPHSKVASPRTSNIWAGVSARGQGPSFEYFLYLFSYAVFVVCN